MSYVEQFIKESQLLYPRIFKNPLDVLTHLFFANGNGYSMLDDNPAVQVGFARGDISFEEYFAVEKSFTEMCDYYTKCHTESEVKFISGLVNLDENPIQYTNEYWISQMLDSPYFRVLNLYPGYFLCYEFSEKTDPTWLNIVKSLIDAYIHYFENFDSYSEGKMNPFNPRGMALFKTPISEKVEKDLEILNALKTKLSEIFV